MVILEAVNKMNKNKMKVQALSKELKEKGFELKIEEPEDNFCGLLQDCAWFEGKIASIENDVYIATLSAVGDLRGELKLPELDGSIVFRSARQFREYCAEHIKEDRVLYALIDSEEPDFSLIFWNNNWLEYDIVNKVTGQHWDVEFSTVVDGNNVLEELLDIEGIFDFIEENSHIFEGQTA